MNPRTLPLRHPTPPGHPLIALLSAPFALCASLLIAPLTSHAQQWETWTACQLIPHPWNDGDSFHINYRGQRHVIRLYYVDSPETHEDFPGAKQRLREQARFFGINRATLLQIGHNAANFTTQQLSRPFTVLTCREDARGLTELGRIFAFVKTADGRDLGEELVRNGLARSYGAAGSPPGENYRRLRQRYDALQLEAFKNRLGAWANSRRKAPPQSSGGPPPSSSARPSSSPNQQHGPSKPDQPSSDPSSEPLHRLPSLRDLLP